MMYGIDMYFKIHSMQIQVVKIHKPLDIDHVMPNLGSNY
jgi:hypothetical protein